MIRTLISLILLALLVRWKWDELQALVRRYVDLDLDYEIWSSRAEMREGTSTASPKPSQSSEEVVYVTASGTRYHRADCRTAGKDAQAIPLTEAKKSYKPCGRCKPVA